MRTIMDTLMEGESMTTLESSSAPSKPEPTAGSRQAEPKTWFTDPFALLDSLGLGYKSAPNSLSFETLRQMSEQNVIVAAIIQTRVHQVASFTRPQPNKYSVGFKVRPRDRYRKVRLSDIEVIKKIERFILKCGADDGEDRDDFETYVKKLVRDRLTYDQMCSEIVSKFSGKPHAFYAVPAATIRLAAPKKRKGSPMSEHESRQGAKYVQLIDGVIANTYTPNELIFSVANPRTELRAYGYGLSELELLVKTVTAHLFAEEWNRRQFTQGSTAKGILNIKGNLPPQQLESFKRQWLSQISGANQGWWKTPIVNSNEEIQWISLQPTNEEMGYAEWLQYLLKITTAIYLIDPAEINFDVRSGVAQAPMFMGTNEAQQKVSQDRGLRPLLRHIENHVNKIVERLVPEYEFEYVGLDSKTEEEAIELRLKELQSYKTLNEVREYEQLPPVEYGDVIPNPSYIGYRTQKEMAAAQGAGGGAPGGGPAGFQSDAEAGSEVDDARNAMKREMGEAPKKSKPAKIADRHRPEDKTEEWEATYKSAAKIEDIQKAAGPFHAFLR